MAKLLTRPRWTLLILLVLTLLAAMPVLEHPPTRDQGFFAYIGWRWLEGEVPYRDGVDIKGPGIHLIYAQALRLSKALGLDQALGPSASSFLGVRLVEVAWRLLTVAAFFTLLMAVHRRVNLAVWVAGLFYSVIDTLIYTRGWSSAQTENFMELPLILCFLAAYQALASNGRQRALYMLGSGVACGLAASIKLTGLFPLGALLLHDAIELAGRRETLLEIARRLAVWLLGAAAALLPFVAYFAAQGALDDMVDILWTFNSYHAHLNLPWVLGSVLASFYARVILNAARFDLQYVAAIVGVGVMLLQATRKERRVALLVWWLLAAFLSVSLQGKFFEYHWAVTAAPLALAAGYGVAWFVGQLARSERRWLAAAGGLILLAGAISSLYRADPWQWTLFAGRRLGTASDQAFYDRFSLGDHSYQVDQEVATFLAGHTTPDDCLLVWGYEPLIYFLAERAACSRYIFDYPLTSQYAPDSWLDRARATFMAEIEDRPPAYIAVAHGDVNPLESEDSARQLAGFTPLAQIVEQDYCLETTIGRFEILRRCAGER